jgi:hypothetical protein
VVVDAGTWTALLLNWKGKLFTHAAQYKSIITLHAGFRDVLRWWNGITELQARNLGSEHDTDRYHSPIWEFVW